MSWRNGRISRNFRPVIFLPRKQISPSEEISRRMASPSVVLPEPDSPTMPSVSPLRTAMLTPSTALMCPTVLRSTPRLIGNQTLRSLASSTSGASGCNGAGSGFGSAASKRAGIRMLRSGKDSLDRPLLDDLALLHHADSVGELAHDAEVVGDEEHCHAEPRLQLLEKLEDLRLHGDVERGGRLVGDQEIGLVGERHRDHHALALAAGQLMRIALQPRLRLGDADLGQEFERARAGGCAGHALMQQQDLANLLLDHVQRIERGHRLLEDDGDVVAAHVTHFAFRKRQEIATLEPDRTGRMLRGRIRQQLHHRERGDGFS